MHLGNALKLKIGTGTLETHPNNISKLVDAEMRISLFLATILVQKTSKKRVFASPDQGTSVGAPLSGRE